MAEIEFGPAQRILIPGDAERAGRLESVTAIGEQGRPIVLFAFEDGGWSQQTFLEYGADDASWATIDRLVAGQPVGVATENGRVLALFVNHAGVRVSSSRPEGGWSTGRRLSRATRASGALVARDGGWEAFWTEEAGDRTRLLTHGTADDPGAQTTPFPVAALPGIPAAEYGVGEPCLAPVGENGELWLTWAAFDRRQPQFGHLRLAAGEFGQPGFWTEKAWLPRDPAARRGVFDPQVTIHGGQPFGLWRERNGEGNPGSTWFQTSAPDGPVLLDLGPVRSPRFVTTIGGNGAPWLTFQEADGSLWLARVDGTEVFTGRVSDRAGDSVQRLTAFAIGDTATVAWWDAVERRFLYRSTTA